MDRHNDFIKDFQTMQERVASTIRPLDPLPPEFKKKDNVPERSINLTSKFDLSDIDLNDSKVQAMVEDISNEMRKRHERAMVQQYEIEHSICSTAVAESDEPELTWEDILEAKKILDKDFWERFFDGLGIDKETHTVYLNTCHEGELPEPPEGCVEFVEVLEENQVVIMKDIDHTDFITDNFTEFI